MDNPEKRPLCASVKLQLGLSKYGTFALEKCKDCGVRFWWPLEFAGKAFYDIAEFNAAYTDKEAPIYWRERQFLEHPPLSGGKLLEIGFGKGRFLHEAQGLGFDVWGIDISEKAYRIAKQLYDFEHIFNENFLAFAERTDIGTFDTICFFEVLEHQADPIGFLSLVSRLLKPGGCIAFSVPDLERVGGPEKDKAEFPPNHPFQYGEKGLTALLSRGGFSMEKIAREPFSKDYFFQDGGTLRFGFMSFLKKRLFFSQGPELPESRNIEIMDQEQGQRNIPWRMFMFIAQVWKIVATLLLLPVVLVMRLSGRTWWDMYGFAKKRS